ncbi:MAG TPA: TonB family protein [Acidobacteriota bacterium]
MRTLIIASLIFLFIAVGGVVGYLYFVAEPKRHPDEPATSSEPQTSKPVEKGQQVPLPDAEPSQPSQPQQPQKQQQEVPTPPEQTEKEIPTAVPQETPRAEPPAEIVKPVLIHRVNPEYPEVARKARVEGTVILEAIINQNGDVENVKVLRGVHPLLDQAAVNAVRNWRYKPLISKQKVHTTVTVKFKLK